MGTLTDAVNALDQSIGTMTSITVNSDGTMRGAKGSPSGGIYIHRDGSVTVGSAGGSLTITLEGGIAKWAGQLAETGYMDPFFTPAQRTVLEGIMSHVIHFGPDLDKLTINEYI